MPAPHESLQTLASIADEADQERAWSEFLATYSHVILRVARVMGGGHDSVMDRYAFVLDALRRDGLPSARSVSAGTNFAEGTAGRRERARLRHRST